MNDINIDWTETLHTQKKCLEQLIDTLRARLKEMPSGNLRVVRKKRGYQYYFRSDGDNSSGKFICSSYGNDLQDAAVYAQSEYYRKMLNQSEIELKRINRLLALADSRHPANVFDDLHPGKQILVAPLIAPDRIFLEQWLNREYTRPDFGDSSPHFTTDRMEKVRSKSEQLIANMLFRCDIPYLPEKPLTLDNGKVVHPDFTILDMRNRSEIYYEHFGMMDNPNYANKAFTKLKWYEDSGYMINHDLFVTWETSLLPFDVTKAEKKLKRLLGMKRT